MLERRKRKTATGMKGKTKGEVLHDRDLEAVDRQFLLHDRDLAAVRYLDAAVPSCLGSSFEFSFPVIRLVIAGVDLHLRWITALFNSSSDSC